MIASPALPPAACPRCGSIAVDVMRYGPQGIPIYACGSTPRDLVCPAPGPAELEANVEPLTLGDRGVLLVMLMDATLGQRGILADPVPVLTVCGAVHTCSTPCHSPDHRCELVAINGRCLADHR